MTAAPYRTLVFPACNEPGLEIIASLVKSKNFDVLAGSSVDPEFDPSRLLVRQHVQCPHLSDPAFRDNFSRIIRERGIALVFATVDSLVAEFASWSAPPCTFVVPDAEVARLVLSKRRLYERLRDVIQAPKIYDARPPAFPVYAKPECGAGSRDHMLVTNDAELDLARSRGLLVTEYLPGDEYTVDCVGDRSGRLLHAAPRRRARIGRGIALGTRSDPHPEIRNAVQTIGEKVRIAGPWFAQFRLDAGGTPKLLEVNTRVAGSMGHTRLSGVNIPQIAAFSFLGFPVRVPQPVAGLQLNRSLSFAGEIDDFDWVIWDLEDTLLRKDRKPDPDAVACLLDLHNRGKRQLLVTRHPDPRTLLRQQFIPSVFESVHSVTAKPACIRALVREYGIDLGRCVAVNDSVIERLEQQAAFPALRQFAPDAVAALGRQRV